MKNLTPSKRYKFKQLQIKSDELRRELEHYGISESHSGEGISTYLSERLIQYRDLIKKQDKLVGFKK